MWKRLKGGTRGVPRVVEWSGVLRERWGTGRLRRTVPSSGVPWVRGTEARLVRGPSVRVVVRRVRPNSTTACTGPEKPGTSVYRFPVLPPWPVIVPLPSDTVDPSRVCPSLCEMLTVCCGTEGHGGGTDRGRRLLFSPHGCG